jgi:hypothetical protein
MILVHGGALRPSEPRPSRIHLDLSKIDAGRMDIYFEAV